MTNRRKSYNTDINDAEQALVAPCLTPLPEDAGQRCHDLRAVLNAPPMADPLRFP